MTQEFYMNQIERLKTHFGVKAFSSELIKVLAFEAVAMSDDYFRRTVDGWIGARKISNPPLLPDFKIARGNYERGKLYVQPEHANSGFNHGLKDVLRRVYKVDTIEEAFELEALKIRLGGLDGKKEGGST